MTLFLKKIVYGRYAMRAPLSPTLLAEMIVTRNATFTGKCRSEHVARGYSGGHVGTFSTIVRSHAGVGS